MTKNIVKLFIASAFAILSLNANVHAAMPKKCGSKSLVGSYGFSLAGSNLKLNLPYAIVGRFVSDGVGNLTGTSTQTVGGKIYSNVFTATYEVSENCDGNANLEFKGGARAQLDFVIVSDGSEAMMLVKDPGTVEWGLAKKQFRNQHK
jgi:hypothetical protein